MVANTVLYLPEHMERFKGSVANLVGVSLTSFSSQASGTNHSIVYVMNNLHE